MKYTIQHLVLASCLACLTSPAMGNTAEEKQRPETQATIQAGSSPQAISLTPSSFENLQANPISNFDLPVSPGKIIPITSITLEKYRLGSPGAPLTSAIAVRYQSSVLYRRDSEKVLHDELFSLLQALPIQPSAIIPNEVALQPKHRDSDNDKISYRFFLNDQGNWESSFLYNDRPLTEARQRAAATR